MDTASLRGRGPGAADPATVKATDVILHEGEGGARQTSRDQGPGREGPRERTGSSEGRGAVLTATEGRGTRDPHVLKVELHIRKKSVFLYVTFKIYLHRVPALN